MVESRMINIGCGAVHHPEWINLDVHSTDPHVLNVDISGGLPFPSGFAAACYSSHVLEHFDVDGARHLVTECFRVLRRGGVIRLVVPDLEMLAREYLKTLDAVVSDDSTGESDYDWLMLELFDQTVRDFSGGRMARFLAGLAENNRAFVRARIGAEAEKFWLSQPTVPAIFIGKSPSRLIRRGRELLAGWLVRLIAGKAAQISFHKGLFRDSGEVHQWMYDRFSLKRLLEQAGFVNVKICSAGESRIPEYGKYALDVSDGKARKPDSLYIESSKP